MSIYESQDCGGNRNYEFRVLRDQMIRFRVKAAHDASLCLTTVAAAAKKSSAMYEIFIGGWQGQESAIRRDKKQDLCKVKTPSILSQHEFRGFWVVVSKKAIKVGREGEVLSFMSYTATTKSLRPTHYGYCTAWGSTGSWTFCDDNPPTFWPDLKKDMGVVESSRDSEVESSAWLNRSDLSCVGKKSSSKVPRLFRCCLPAKSVHARSYALVPPITGKVHESLDHGGNRKYVFCALRNQVFRFRVKAAHDANICLTTAAAVTPSSMYEIFIGGWQGKESAIRKDMKQDLCKVMTPSILSQHEFRGFWVIVSRKAIQVGREGEVSPFMSYTDPTKSLKPTHYGYCTAWGSTGSWTFCDEDPTYFVPEQYMNGIGDNPTYFGPALNWHDLASTPEKKTPLPSLSPDMLMQQPPPKYSELPPPPRYSARANPPSYSQLHQMPLSYSLSSPSHKLPLKWVLCGDGSQCSSPVVAGPGLNPPLVAAANHQGSLIPGVLHPGSNACQVPWGGVSHNKKEYYLLSNMGGTELDWVAASGGYVPKGAVQGGTSETQEKLYVGRVKVGASYIPGKVHPSHKTCYVINGRGEASHPSYEVLCHKTFPVALFGYE